MANLYGYVDNRPTTFVDPSGWLKVAITARDFDRACGYYSVLWAVTPRAFERSAITAPPSPRSSGPRFVMGYVVQKVSIWNNVIDCRIQCPDTFFWDVSDWLPALKPDKVFWEALGPVLANGQQSVRDLSRNDMHLYEYGYHFGMGELRFFPVDDLGCLGRGTGDLSRDQNWKEVIPEANGLPATTTEPRFWNEPVDGPVLRIAGTRWSCCGPHAEWFNLPFALAGEQKK